MTGIEPVTPTWKDGMLPLHHIRKSGRFLSQHLPSHGSIIIYQILYYVNYFGTTEKFKTHLGFFLGTPAA